MHSHRSAGEESRRHSCDPDAKAVELLSRAKLPPCGDNWVATRPNRSMDSPWLDCSC